MNSNARTCVCSKCRSDIMIEDAREVRDYIICTDCISKMVDRDSVARPVKTSSRSISAFLLFIFSAVPGVNYMYLGMMTKGLLAMSLFFGMKFLIVMGAFVFIFALPIVYFYCLFDSFAIRRRMYANEEFYDMR